MEGDRGENCDGMQGGGGGLGFRIVWFLKELN